MSASQTKSCPDCGAANIATALFCEECGASLAMVDADSSATTAFVPVSPQPTSSLTAPIPAATGVNAVASAPTYGANDSAPVYQSMRGAVLGWIAGIMILLILGFFMWSSVMSDAARDRLTSLF